MKITSKSTVLFLAAALCATMLCQCSSASQSASASKEKDDGVQFSAGTAGGQKPQNVGGSIGAYVSTGNDSHLNVNRN